MASSALALLVFLPLVSAGPDLAASLGAFQDFVSEHGRQYSSSEEEQRRLAIFQENYAFILAQNAKNLSFRLAVNQFADLTHEEIEANYMGLAGPEEMWPGAVNLGTDNVSDPEVELPAYMDWSTMGYVTPVKSQGQCGSCWAFSAAGALESAWAIAGHGLVPLSEQYLMDCGFMSCHGGRAQAGVVTATLHGVCTEYSYPYRAAPGSCRSGCTKGIPAGKVLGFRQVATKWFMKMAVARQPISAAVAASGTFSFYRGGIITQGCGFLTNHAILIVGYGTVGGIEFWKVKNSWGPGWGESGYVRISSAGLMGECSINGGGNYPAVSRASASAPSGEMSASQLEQSSPANSVVVV